MKKCMLLLLFCFTSFSLISCNDNVMPFPKPNSSYEKYLIYIEKYGAITKNSSEFKNTTKNVIKTKEEAIELAKNEITEEYGDYSQINAYFDKKSSMWWIVFYIEDIIGSGQSVFIDSNGITQLVVYDG